MNGTKISSKALISVLVFIILFTFPLDVFSTNTKADVTMEVKAGFDGIAKLGVYIPYRVLVINKGKAVEGEVQVEVKIDSQHRTVFSQPVSLAEGASKEIVINAPIFTARRGVTVRFLESGKVIKELEYAFSRLIPPDIKTVGVLSSDNSAYDFLNGAMIPSRENTDFYEKEMLMKASGMYATHATIASASEEMLYTIDMESVLIPLNEKEFPDDIKVMNGFDILIISNYDTSNLSEEQLNSLEAWVNTGGTVVLGTGRNWTKVYNSLPAALKRFTVDGISTESSVNDLSGFIGGEYNDSSRIDAVTGDIGFEYIEPESIQQETPEEPADENLWKPSLSIDEVLLGDDTNPLIVKYAQQSGRVLFLTFDPGMEPVVSWEGRALFWRNLLYHSSSVETIYQRGTGYYYSNYENYNYLNTLANQVPEDIDPPFKFMFIMLGIYIIIVGPAMYLFLKKKDKRDYSWLAVPAVAILSLVIIYFAGFKTRYKTAVFNTASLITLDSENQKADITTSMGIFNNKRGDLKLNYSEKDNIDFDITQFGSNNYRVYSDDTEPAGKVVSKLILSEPVTYELYDVSMWEPTHISGKKTEPFTEQIINSVQIKDGKLKMEINNATKYDFYDAFISIGSNFIDVGDILSGDRAYIEKVLNSSDVYNSLEQYLDDKYGRTYYPSNIKPPENFPEKRRKRIITSNLFEQQRYAIRGEAVIGLYALNNQDLDFDIMINGENPKSYFTNGIFSSMKINFEKGQEVDIPTGILMPETENFDLMQEVAYLDSDNGLTVRSKGDIDFTYSIPKEIRPTEFSLAFDTYVPLYVKYNIEDMKANNSNAKTSILQNKYEYYLFSNKTNEWQEIDAAHTQNVNVEEYLDSENKIRVRVRVVEIAESKTSMRDEYTESERLAFPQLHLKGVVQ